MSKFPITKKGFEKLTKEIKTLKAQERPKVIQAIAEAREFGDLSENAEYHAAKDKQSFIEGRIIELEDKTARSVVIDPTTLTGDTIKFGAKVTLIDDATEKEEYYFIVGQYEADISKRMISIVSPLAKAMIGKSPADIIEVTTPKGLKSYEIISVEYIDFEV